MPHILLSIQMDWRRGLGPISKTSFCNFYLLSDRKTKGQHGDGRKPTEEGGVGLLDIAGRPHGQWLLSSLRATAQGEQVKVTSVLGR